ncbi:MAG TPA: chemotaxis protein CheB [Kofleriaceae bacterium]|nr:chemotaxis protein CheB [Kofleriaceae bacterium]
MSARTTALRLIVIGGSAGALDVMLELCAALPDTLTTPIVIVLHLQASHISLVPELLARTCRRPVREVEDKLALEAGTVYVAPPNYHVLVERGATLALSVDAPVHYSRPSIDVLFETAADSFGAATLGVVLSGANEDGARGLARIHRAGGAAVVQDPATALYPTMPTAALAAVGRGAQVLSIAELSSLFARLDGGMNLHQDSLR